MRRFICGLGLVCVVAAVCWAGAEATPTPKPIPENVAARVNGEDVSVDDYNEALVNYAGESVLDVLVNKKMIDQGLKAKGIEIDPGVLAGRLEEVKKEIAPLTMEDYLQQAAMSPEVFEAMLSLEIGAERLLRADKGLSATDPKPTEADFNEWYAKFKASVKIETPKETNAEGVAATVNGEPISTKEWVKWCRDMVRDDLESRILDTLVDDRLVRQEIRKADIAITPEDVERELAVRKKLFEDDPRTGDVTYEELLQSRGDSVDALKASDGFKASLGVQRLLSSKIAEEELAAYFEERRANLSAGLVRAQHILIRSTAPDTGEPNFEAALAEAQDLRKKLDEGSDFAALAAAYSEDPGSKARGGDLGYFRREQVVAPFADAAFSLKKGEISQPVKTQFGYHIIKVTDIIPPRDLKLDDVRELLIRELVGKHERDWLEGVKKSAKIEKNESLFGAAEKAQESEEK